MSPSVPKCPSCLPFDSESYVRSFLAFDWFLSLDHVSRLVLSFVTLTFLKSRGQVLSYPPCPDILQFVAVWWFLYKQIQVKCFWQGYCSRWCSSAFFSTCLLYFSLKCVKSGVIFKNSHILIFKYPAGQLLISDSCHQVVIEALGYLYRSFDWRGTYLGSSDSSIHGILPWLSVLNLRKKHASGYSCSM